MTTQIECNVGARFFTMELVHIWIHDNDVNRARCGEQWHRIGDCAARD